MPSKINSYVNFAKRSRAIVYGLDFIEKKKVKLILYSEALGQNSVAKCSLVAQKYGCNLVKLNSTLFAELFESAKVVGITNDSLAKAIEGELN